MNLIHKTGVNAGESEFASPLVPVLSDFNEYMVSSFLQRNTQQAILILSKRTGTNIFPAYFSVYV